MSEPKTALDLADERTMLRPSWEWDKTSALLEAIPADATERIARLEKALEPFAKMDRLECDLGELAFSRGIPSLEGSMLFSRDFREARLALGWSERKVEGTDLCESCAWYQDKKCEHDGDCIQWSAWEAKGKK